MKNMVAKKRSLVVAIITLLLIEAALLWYIWGLLKPAAPEIPLIHRPALTPVVQVTAGPTAQPVSTPIVQDVVRQAGQLAREGDFVAMALAFDEEEAFAHIETLAGPEFAGRQPGTPGGQAAADYIAARFAEYGLQPAGDDGTYFQNFTVPFGQWTSTPTLEVVAPDGTVTSYTYRVDFRPRSGGYVGGGQAEGPVIWLNRCQPDDFRGQDVVDKVVLCRAYHSQQIYRQAIEYHVGGLLLITDDTSRLAMGRSFREVSWVPETFPVYEVSPMVAESLLTGSGYTLDDLSIQYLSFPLTTHARMSVSLVEEADAPARNVLGVLPGRDPTARAQVVILGGHYDHLGQAPDGAIFAGANDDASGVAVLLEIARLWQEQGYVPQRTVLFAAWDAEEQGLLGSIHYVEHPRYPLDSTVAMLQLDMVGAGEGDTLQIDGTGLLADQLTVSSSILGITTTVADDGGSDHVPFQGSDIPASALAWFDGTNDTTYHTAADVPANIVPQKLRAVGALTAHALLALSESQVDVERTVARMAETVIQDDAVGYAALMDAADYDFLAQQAGWFEEMRSRLLEQFELTAERIMVDGEEATATLRLRYRWSDESRANNTSFPARFVRRDGQWRYAGPAVKTSQSAYFSIGYLAAADSATQTWRESSRREWVESADEIYVSLTEKLGLPPQTSMRVLLFPRDDVLSHLTRPTESQGTSSWVLSGRTAWVVASTPITTVVTQLALNQTGLPADALPWLRESLPLVLAGQGADDAGILPLLTSTEALPTAGDFPSLDTVSGRDADRLRSQARSMTVYLLEKHGWDGIRAMGEAWARTGDGEAAFRQALGLDSAEFTAAWQAEVLQPARQAKADIEALAARRQGAIVAGDIDALLATVDQTNPTLLHETQSWAADLTRYPAKAYTTTVTLHTLTGDRAEASLHIDYVGGGYKGEVDYRALFVQRDGQWLYGGLAWQTLSDGHFLIKYQERDEEWAQGVLAATERAYEHVSRELPLAPALPLEIELYSSPLIFRPLVMLSLPPWARQWAEPGGAIKLVAQEDDPQRYAAPLAGAFARMALCQMGVDDTWLHEGVAEFLAGQMEPLGPQEVAARYVSVLQQALNRDKNTFPFEQMPSMLKSDEEQAQLIYAQSWSGVTYFEELFGRETLLAMIQTVGRGTTVEEFFTQEMSLTPDDFAADWKDWGRGGQLSLELLAQVQGFDADAALEHVQRLASPGLSGRQAGTPEDRAVADFLADEFARAGLVPVGDEGTYLQSFPITYTHLLSVPVCAVLDAQGTAVHTFNYPDDFRPVTEGAAGRGTTEAQVVWVRDDEYTDMHLGGRIVLRPRISNPVAEAKKAMEHGASGLIVATNRTSDYLRVRSVIGDSVSTNTIPVFEISKDTLDQLLALSGNTLIELNNSPPALLLDLRLRMGVEASTVQTTTQNVLGAIPGTDPDAGVLVLGTHYDGLGHLPNGLLYPGANRNASGVGVLLEIARLWQRNSWQPQRTILFAAWGGGELNHAGAQHYVAHPAYPVTDTLLMLELDTVGAGRGYYLDVHAVRGKSPGLSHVLNNGAEQLKRRVSTEAYQGDGGHVPFHDNGVLTALLSWSDARDLRTPKDTAETIDLPKLATTGEVVSLALYLLAR
jgi:Zn-dependent M28 family amino/carboxypeptidase/uncharacterized protein YchJ